MTYKISPKNLISLTLSILHLQANTPIQDFQLSSSHSSSQAFFPTNQDQNILNVFKDYLLKSDIDKKSVYLNDDYAAPHKFPDGLEDFLQKIHYFTLQNKPLIFNNGGLSIQIFKYAW